ncbi:hypothetical protein FE634_04025 [Nocardioides dongxiaopingii]|uniref:hypothetical protein n=1 Tax=Nocardioides sp. S-1144 TaxID=2582905 RepID=UPI00110F4F7D|nr:hypothetical protein [Nocardioides sp. S-1144]QCW49783.1 hypothetical protein FE634_04025 [Nocardioides sp. S-1144]
MALAQHWPIEEVPLDDLDLDLRNVRIPSGHADEMAIAAYLVEAADLLTLVRDILRDGYLDNELPLITASGVRHVVLEGNRRITALKAIKDPSVVGKAAPQVERLKTRYPHGETPTVVRVMIAPSREAALPLLARLHTSNPKKSWVREQQAIFYHSQLTPSVTVDDLRTTYIGETQMMDYIRMGEMRELIRGLRYADTALREFVFSGNLKMTAFEYVYEKRQVQDALGISFNKDGMLASKKMNKKQQNAFIYVLQRLKEGTLNTRSPELKVRGREHKPFVDLLAQIVSGIAPSPGTPDTGASDDAGTGNSHEDNHTDASEHGDGGNGTGDVGIGGRAGTGSTGAGGTGGDAGDVDSGSGTRGPNRGDTLSRLNMDGFAYTGTSPAMRRRFEELRRIDVRDFANATHDLLRTVLECSIKEYMRVQGNPIKPNSTIGYCVEEVAKAFAKDRRMTVLINTINRKGRMSTSQFVGTTEALNSSNHEPDHFVEGREVHEAWDRLKPILNTLVGS